MTPRRIFEINFKRVTITDKLRNIFKIKLKITGIGKTRKYSWKRETTVFEYNKFQIFGTFRRFFIPRIATLIMARPDTLD